FPSSVPPPGSPILSSWNGFVPGPTRERFGPDCRRAQRRRTSNFQCVGISRKRHGGGYLEFVFAQLEFLVAPKRETDANDLDRCLFKCREGIWSGRQAPSLSSPRFVALRPIEGAVDRFPVRSSVSCSAQIRYGGGESSSLSSKSKLQEKR